MKYYIYAHSKSPTQEINDFFYVGKGCGNRAKRTNHRNQYWKNMVAKNNSKFYVHFLQTNLTEDEAFFYEILYIQIFGKKIEDGLLVNMTDGGEGISGHKLSEETKRKISEAHKGKIIPEYVKEKLRIYFGSDKNPRIGKKTSEETKKKISIANKGRMSYSKHWNWRGNVLQYDKNMNFIAEYSTSREAEEKTGVTQSGIRNCINKNYGRKSAGGYIWIRKTVKHL